MSEYPITTFASTLHENIAKETNRIADIASSYNWEDLLNALEGNSSEINKCHLPENEYSEVKLYTPLHQAAFGKAPKEVFEKLVKMGASKSFKTTEGETAYDIAKRVGLAEDILKLIEVPEKVQKNQELIKKMEEGLHKTIMERAESLVKKHGLQLPQLSYLYEFGEFWYPVPGMYGGFNVSECKEGVQTESWCRVVGGSGQRHVISRDGTVKLVDEGFV